jgi:hypothetical protein
MARESPGTQAAQITSVPLENVASQVDPQTSLFALPPLIWPLLASALVWLLLFACFPPGRQDFPLNDDWGFGRGAMRFATGEGVHYSNWASMP